MRVFALIGVGDLPVIKTRLADWFNVRPLATADDVIKVIVT